MRIVGRDKLDEFCDRYADARRWIENWLSDAERATWAAPYHIRARYSAVSFLADNVVIFNVKGNDYRLEVRVAYKTSVVVILWVGTHADYDKRNKRR
jgi:mRNA interferase HigB